MTFLLDTNVLSELRKGDRANRGVRAWFEQVEPEQLYLSVVVLGEVQKGIELIRRRDVASADALARWCEAVVRNFGARILPIDLAVASRWGRLQVPDPRPVLDSLIAATALEHQLTVVTHNVRDFAATGVAVLDPFA